ncbi:hypothetical protein MHF_1021 [Mycoplasma haemofelis Ohio2]|uniref:Uncharacterized protein n=1 Tax=Mycoplasma haemofelis (strain Ohio2) TaxID=859194 RepID=F6FJ77_MYCHI|nr:hypothetical protein MHF_1021 [Mycoplasma haemofelis Ohio2]
MCPPLYLWVYGQERLLREGLYIRSFRRNKGILIHMDLDDFMNESTGDEEGAVALGIWCDSHLRRKRYFVSLDGCTSSSC